MSTLPDRELSDGVIDFLFRQLRPKSVKPQCWQKKLGEYICMVVWSIIWEIRLVNSTHEMASGSAHLPTEHIPVQVTLLRLSDRERQVNLLILGE